MNKNIYEIGMEMEIYENRLFDIKNKMNDELNKFDIDWNKIYNLSKLAVDYTDMIKENLLLKLEKIKEIA